MSDRGRAVRRAILVGVVAWSLLTALVFAVFGAAILMARAYDAADLPAYFGVIFLGYAIFLMAFSAGILRERAWAWYAGFGVSGVSALLGIQSATRHSWGASAFDLIYGAVLAGTLLWSRKAGATPD